MVARSVAQIVAGVRGGPPLCVVGSDSTMVAVITHDSREVRPASLYCCIRGEHVDGHDFARTAVDAGATALLADHGLDETVARAATQLITADVRLATGWVAASVFDHPCDSLRTIAVTGTNGKTTTTQLIGAIRRAAGERVEVFGTLSGKHTTPEAPELQRRLARCRDDGVGTVAMEVSSHALELERVAGAHFDVSVFTNLGRDHLDLHGTVERYFAAKARLFEPGLSTLGVVNVDDVHGRLLLDSAEIPIEVFSLSDIDDVVVTATRHSYRWRGQHVSVGIGGRFNVMNSLAAATACAASGIEPAAIAAALTGAGPVPGRFEPIDVGQPFATLVDFAHTPDGLREALTAARLGAEGGRVIVVFGCGGDRDRDKRPEMGAVAADLADVVVMTSDNPRSEDPMDIIDATVAGVPEGYRANVVIEPDRRTAIGLALTAAGAGDVVVIAGKGHETTQTIGTTITEFDDRVVARELLGERS